MAEQIEVRAPAAALDDLPPGEQELTLEQAEGAEGGIVVTKRSEPSEPDPTKTEFHWG